MWYLIQTYFPNQPYTKQKIQSFLNSEKLNHMIGAPCLQSRALIILLNLPRNTLFPCGEFWLFPNKTNQTFHRTRSGPVATWIKFQYLTERRQLYGFHLNSVTKAHCVMFGSEKFYNLHSLVKYTLKYTTPSYFSDFRHLRLCHCYTSQAPPTHPKPPLALPHWKALPYTLPQLPGNSRTLLPVCVDIFHPV